MKKIKLPKVSAPAKPVSPAAAPKKCRAAELGHRGCKCGGPDCGANMHDPYAV